MPVYIQRETLDHVNSEYSNLSPKQKKKKYNNIAERVIRAKEERDLEEQTRLLEEKQQREADTEREKRFQEAKAQQAQVTTPTILDLSGTQKQTPLIDLSAPTIQQREDEALVNQARDLQKKDLKSFIEIPENATPEEAAMIMEQQGKHESRLVNNIVETLRRGAANTAYNLVGQSTFAGPDQEKEAAVINKIEKMFPYKSYDWNLFSGDGENIYETFASNLQTYLNRNALYDNLYASKKFPTYDLPQDEFDPTKGSTYVNVPYQANKAIAGIAYDLLLSGGLRAGAGKATGWSLSKYAEDLGEKYFQKLLTKGVPKSIASFTKFGTKAIVNAPVAGGSLFNYTYSQNVNNLINSEGYSISDPRLYNLALKRSLVESSLEGIFDQTKFLQGGGEELAGFFGKKAVLKQTAKNVGKEMLGSSLEEFTQSIATAPFDFDAADKKILEIQQQVKDGKISPEDGQAMVAETKMTIGKAIKQATGEGIVGSVTPVILKSVHLPALTLNNAETQALGHAIENQDALNDYLDSYLKTAKTPEAYKEKSAQATKIKDFVSQVKNEYDYWTTNNAPELYQQSTGRKVMSSNDAMKMGVQVAKLNSVAQQLTTSTDDFQTNNLKSQAQLITQSIKNINNGTDIGQNRVTGEEIATMVAKTTPLGYFTIDQANQILQQPAFQQDILSGARDFNRIAKNDPQVSQYVQDIEQGRLVVDDKVSGNPILDANNNIIDGKKRFAKAFADAKKTGIFSLAVTKAVEGKALLGIAAASATEIPSSQIITPFKGNALLNNLFEGVAKNFEISRQAITNNKENKPDSEVNADLEDLIFNTIKELALSGVKYNDLSTSIQRIAGITPMVAEGNIKYMANNNLLPNSEQIKTSLKAKAQQVVEANKQIGLDDELNLPVETRQKLAVIEKEKDAQIAAIPIVAEQTANAKQAIKKNKNTKVKKEASILLNDPKAYYEGMVNEAIQLKLNLEEQGQPTQEADAAIQQYTEVTNQIKTIEEQADAKKAVVTKKKSAPATKAEEAPVVESNEPINAEQSNVLVGRLNDQIKEIDAQIATLRQEEVSLGTVEYKPEGKIVGYVGSTESSSRTVVDKKNKTEDGKPTSTTVIDTVVPMSSMTKEFVPGVSLYTVEQTKDGYNLIPYNAMSSLNNFIDRTALTFDPVYNAAEDIKAKQTQQGNFVSVTGAKYSSTKVTATQPAEFKKVKGKLVLTKKGIAFWGKPYEVKIKVNNVAQIQELQKQKEDLYQQINDVRSAEGAQAAEATSRVYKAKLNVMAKEIEKNLTNIFDQMGVKRPENLTPKCP
jgi:hypothetical protein